MTPDIIISFIPFALLCVYIIYDILYPQRSFSDFIIARIKTNPLRISAATILLIAAIWFAWKISSFSSLSSVDAKFWLHRSEQLLLWSTVLLAGGIAGEWPDSESWKKRALYTFAKSFVLIGVIGEFLGDAAIFESSTRLQSIQEKEVAALEVTVADTTVKARNATVRAATAEAEAANLLKENVELENALAPRDFDQGALVRALAALPKVPIILIPLEREEPTQLSSYIFSALTGISIGGSTPWSVTTEFEHEWNPEGIKFEYVSDWNMGQPLDKNPETVAAAMCRSLENNGILVGVMPKIKVFADREWPADRPRNAVVVRIGQRPNHFWENKRHREQGSAEVPVYSYCTTDELARQMRQQMLEQRRKRREETEQTP